MKTVKRQIGKHTMVVSATAGGIQKTLRKMKPNGQREPELLYVLKQEIKPGMSVMDLGANIGYLTLMFADWVGKNGFVYAVEPDPENYKLLQQNVKINGYRSRVELKQMGISNKNGAINFYPGKVASNLGSMTKHDKCQDSPVKVKVSTLTDYFKDRKLPELIKMDVEGHEVEILEGMLKLIKSKDFPCKIIMELHPTLYSSEAKMEKIIKEVLANGFKTKYVISAAVAIPGKFKEWGYKPIKVFQGRRGLYDNFSKEHMLIACCYQNKQWMPKKKRYSPKIARYVMLERA